MQSKPSGPSGLLTLDRISMRFPLGRRGLFGGGQDQVHAVNDLSLTVEKGTTLGLVGESGSGKTTVGRIVSQLQKPTEGQLSYEGKDVTDLSGAALREHLPNVQMVFQDPYNSLNPHLTLSEIVQEPLKINRRGSAKDRRKRATELLEAVGISSSLEGHTASELSGGQRQRIAICRALALEPKLVVCDEAVSALDVSTQAKIINLLVDLQKKYNLTYLFISHDLSVVRLVADVVAVMYLGKVVETGPATEIFDNPLHPYTCALVEAVPDVSDRKNIRVLEGEIPSNITLPKGCPFYSRCSQRKDICRQSVPAMKQVENGRQVACFMVDS